MPEIAVISNGVEFTLLPSSHRDEWILVRGGSRVLGIVVHHLPLGWSGNVMHDKAEPRIRASRLDAIEDLITLDRERWLAKFLAPQR